MRRRNAPKAYEVAIVGMACRFPGATDLPAFWELIQSGRDSTTDVPANRWPTATFYDSHPSRNDQVACRRGGYLDEPISFDAASFGVMPLTVEGGEPEQFLILDAARLAIEDAGLSLDTLDGRHVDVIIGRGNYFNRGNLTRLQHGRIVAQTLSILETLHPEWTEIDRETIRADLKSKLPPFGPATIPGQLTNATAGRVASRFDLLGASFVVDAASASSVVALEQACRSLIQHRSKLAIVGGVYVEADVDFPLVFQQLGALSKSGQSRPFSKDADGLLSGEGVGVLVLKRRCDAERDGDRIYAVIQGIGLASDGRSAGLASPSASGHARAIKRAYRQAGILPASVGLIEGHGLGLPVSDRTELKAINAVFPTDHRRILGAISSQIGHAMPASGMAGLIKSALCLHHRILPPSNSAQTPHPLLQKKRRSASLNPKLRPWIHADATPRRVGVNSFGFAGINTHAILEEHTASADGVTPGAMPTWECEAILLSGDDRQGLIEEASSLHRWILAGGVATLKDVAFTLNTRKPGPVRLGLVVASLTDLADRLAALIARMSDPKCQSIRDGRGSYYWSDPLGGPGRLALMFPGEGSQYAGMLADLCPHFPEIRQLFDTADRIARESGLTERPSDILFGAGSDELWSAGIAVNVVLSAQWGLYQLLLKLGIKADAIVGHSSGELLALAAAGVIPVDDKFVSGLARLGGELDRLTTEQRFVDTSLLAVALDRGKVVVNLGDLMSELSVAIDNCPHQVVLAGSPNAIASAAHHLESQGYIAEVLPFSRPYHTPEFDPAISSIDAFLSGNEFRPAEVELYSCATGAKMPAEPGRVRELALAQWSRTVEFRKTIEQMHNDGLRVFIDVGARGNLAGFVEDSLRNRPAFAVAANLPKRSGLTQLNHFVASLFAQGIELDPTILYARRRPIRIDFDQPPTVSRSLPHLRLGFPEMQLSEEVAQRFRMAGFSAERPLVESSQEVLLCSCQNGFPEIEHGAMSLSTLEQEPDAVIQSYFSTMNLFLDTQRDVMSAYLTSKKDPVVDVKYPWVGEIVSHSPQLHIVTHLILTIDGDPIAEHHTLGGRRVSQVDPDARGLPVVPFAVMAEMLAEVASLLVPGLTLVALRDVLAHRWIRYESEPITLELTATRDENDPGVIRVSIANRGTPTEPRPDDPPVVEGLAIFAETRPARPVAGEFQIASARASIFTAESVYAEQWLFHGPALQAVTEIGQIGPRAIEGVLTVLPHQGLLRDSNSASLIIDPIIFDNFTHLLGSWGLDELKQGDVIFPLRLGELALFGDNLPEGSRVKCNVSIDSVDRHKVRAHAEILAADGRVWMRINDWDDWRFHWPTSYRDVLRGPDRMFIGEELDLNLPATVARAVWLEPPGDFAKPVWRDVLEQTMLSPFERESLMGPRGPELRRTLRLWGRIAAKEAVRRIWIDQGLDPVYPADLEISPDEHGRPWLRSLVEPDRDSLPLVSIAHTDGVAVALAVTSMTARLGIDVERIVGRSPGFEAIAFTSAERELLSRMVGRPEWSARFWCAKEAVAKMTGLGLISGPASVIIVDAWTDGTIKVELGPRLSEACPDLVKCPLTVHSHRRGEWIWAWTIHDGDQQ